MWKLVLFFCLLTLIVGAAVSAAALDRQPNADYRARREALAKKASGVVVLFAPLEAVDEVYGFRQEDNFFYLSGVTEPGAALLIVSSAEAKADSPARSYAEILFLPPRNLTQEKWIGPKLGPENPDAAKITGFDRVEQIGKLPDEVTRFISGAFPSIYTDVPAQGEAASTITLAFQKQTNPLLSHQHLNPLLSSLR